MMRAGLAARDKEASGCNSSGPPGRKQPGCGGKGKVLRVKQGYNPNSSSMGSIVFVLPVALLGVTASFGAVSGIIMAAFVKTARKSDSEGEDGPNDSKTSEQLPWREGQ
jgi:hypothetical protein